MAIKQSLSLEAKVVFSLQRTREVQYLKYGCNAFDLARSTPLAIWTEDDGSTSEVVGYRIRGSMIWVTPAPDACGAGLVFI